VFISGFFRNIFLLRDVVFGLSVGFVCRRFNISLVLVCSLDNMGLVIWEVLRGIRSCGLCELSSFYLVFGVE
jgi:hypothetical protein